MVVWKRFSLFNVIVVFLIMLLGILGLEMILMNFCSSFGMNGVIFFLNCIVILLVF